MTIVYDDIATHVAHAKTHGADIWLSPEDLLRATGFELKPEGACRAELCFPLPADASIVKTDAGVTWFNLRAFAQLTGQPVAFDDTSSMWYFGLRSDERAGLGALQAPDFTLPDLDGKPHSLRALRGKKVFLVTWASW
jgi:hypothetical protein